jgi:hypothetical protein
VITVAPEVMPEQAGINNFNQAFDPRSTANFLSEASQ